MTATTVSNPLRPKALEYLRDGRVCVWSVASIGPGQPATAADATIAPAPGDPNGRSVYVRVCLRDRVWHCDAHPTPQDCSHKLAVQLITDWYHLGGKCQP